MEKLIELLNSFETKLEEMPLARKKWREENGILYRRFMNVEDAERMVISKSFGFIKRLVDNDKIEFPTSCAIDKNNDYSEREIKSDYESLLMLLAISENPISDLISYLK